MRGEIQGRLSSGALDHTIKAASSIGAQHCVGSIFVPTINGLCPELLGSFLREASPGNRGHARACVTANLRKQRAQESDSYNGNGFAGLNSAAARDIECARQWFSGECGALEFLRQVECNCS